eukprot:scaffold8027_cov318-Chaetoceros_neogracile.AAC.1
MANGYWLFLLAIAYCLLATTDNGTGRDKFQVSSCFKFNPDKFSEFHLLFVFGFVTVTTIITGNV